MRPDRRDPAWGIAGLGCLGALLLACLGAALIAGVLGLYAGLATIPLRLFQSREPQVQTLYRTLDDGRSAAFRSGGDCTFSSVQGSRVTSNPDNGGFQEDIPRREVTARVRESLLQERFRVQDGDVYLADGSPAEAELLPERRVRLSYDQSTGSDENTLIESVDAVVRGQRWQGDYYFSESISRMTSGELYEEATTLQAAFDCPFLPANPD